MFRELPAAVLPAGVFLLCEKCGRRYRVTSVEEYGLVEFHPDPTNVYMMHTSRCPGCSPWRRGPR